jgi:molecular chaperone DnaK (HSP70)
MTANLVAQTVDITKRALQQAEEKSPGITQKISDVILVGGSSLMPIIPATLKKEFGWDAKLSDPHLAVAKGAALVAAGAVAREVIDEETRKSRQASGQLPPDSGDGTVELAPIQATTAEKEAALAPLAELTNVREEELARLASVVYSGVLPKAVGVKLVDSRIPDWREQLKQPKSDDPRSGPFRVVHLVDPQENLPFTRAEVFKAQTIVPNQDRIEIELWEQAGGTPGEGMYENNPLPVAEDIAYIGDLAKYNLPEGSDIEIYFDISAEGIVTLRAVEPKSGRDLKVTATIALLSPEEMEKSKEIFRGMTTGT